MSFNDGAGLTRRDLFRVGAGSAVAATAAAGASRPAYAQEEFDYDGWFDDALNFDGTVDMTGEDEVHVGVGAGDIGLAFDPAAIHVDPGTTVVFEWTGEGGGHNVAEREADERYESERTDEAGTTYEVTYETDGISRYVCVPHIDNGMVGAVAVGDGEGVPDITRGRRRSAERPTVTATVTTATTPTTRRCRRRWRATTASSRCSGSRPSSRCCRRLRWPF